MPRTTPPLTGTYRVQLHKDFPLGEAARIAGYLARLGVSHLYASPMLTARPGSTHGYDVADPSAVNPELGGEEARRALVAVLRSEGLGLVLDIVPNHMGIGPANPYWEDVLANGRESRYASWFDIDWESPVRALRGRVLLPVLGAELDEVLAKGELTVKREGDAVPRLVYHENDWPLAPRTADELPDVPSADDLRALLARQNYVLAFWKKGAREINYRRFFDVNELAALHAEDAAVFAETHRLPLEWIARGELDGLRVDHVDGLLDPAAYLARLRAEADARAAKAGSPTPVPIFVEKILSPGERLRGSWPVQGTTGYEFLNDLEAVFISPEGDERIEAGYRRMLGLRPERMRFAEVAIRGKLKILRGPLRPDVERLARQFAPMARRDPRGTGLSRRELVETVVQMLAALPVYRTYVDGRSEPTAEDESLVERALSRALERAAVPEEGLRLLADILLLRDPATATDDDRAERLRFVQRFQQTSGPATAKGIEDTALYLYFPLASRNEVGGEPDRELRDAVDAFHRGAAERAKRWPQTLLCTNTHDTKRSADLRARLDVLAELPDEWLAAVADWHRRAAPLRAGSDGRSLPDENTEYLAFQTALGVWPLGGGDALPDAATLRGLAERVHAYLLKASREGKTHTSWTEPNEAFEKALDAWVRGLFDPARSGELLREIGRFARRLARPGLWNALGRVLLHLSTPGTPDLYQGDELWNFALVDPDNRRPVDYAARERLLATVEAAESPEARRALLRETVDAPEDGRVKLLLTRALLQLRRERPALFRDGDYQPLEAEGSHARSVVAFARRAGEEMLVAVATRLPLDVAPGGEAPVGERWGDTTLRLPALPAGGRWTCALSRRILNAADGSTTLAELLADAPVALLVAAGG